jgi:glutathione S-transferase
MATDPNADAPWELYYWANVKEDGRNHMVGRGEFVRLMFEAAGVPYIDHGVQQGGGVVATFCWGGGNATGWPVFAPPAIKKGSFVLSQTPAIIAYLGKKFDMYPTNEEDEARANSINATVTDLITEGRLVFHSKHFTESYYKQVEEVKPTVEWFAKERLPDLLWYLNEVLKHEATIPGRAGEYFVGNRLTYVDIAVFHAVEAAASQFATRFAQLVGDLPLLIAHRHRIAALPRIAAYLASTRRGFFEGNSMM